MRWDLKIKISKNLKLAFFFINFEATPPILINFDVTCQITFSGHKDYLADIAYIAIQSFCFSMQEQSFCTKFGQ